MSDVVEWFRAQFAGRPLLLVLVFVVVALLATRRHGDDLRSARRLGAYAFACAAILGAAALIAYCGIAIWYASTPPYYDYAEPTIAAVAWLFELGRPMYHAVDAPERYAHMYGPMAFILHGWVLAWFGPSIAASKGLGAAAGLASLLFTFLAVRTGTGVRRAAALTGVCALLYLLFRNYTFWTRPEPLQLLAVSAGLWGAVALRGMSAALIVGVTAGVLWNLKVTGPLYSLPVFALLYARTGVTKTLVAAAFGIAVAALPFIAFDNVSFGNYLHWVRLSAGNGLLLATLRQNIEWALYLLLPVLLSYYAGPRETRSTDREWRLLLGTLGLGICGVVLAASKPGASTYHLLPFLPVIVYVTARQLRGLSAGDLRDPVVAIGGLGFLTVTCLIAVAQQIAFLSAIAMRASANEIADIRQFADAHPNAVIEMGYGDGDERPTLARPILVFRSRSYLIDAPAVREHQLAGLDVPASTLHALRACRVRYWLVPKGVEPFSGRNSYPALRLAPLFPEDFRRTFFATHRLDGTTAFYDVWRCHEGAR